MGSLDTDPYICQIIFPQQVSCPPSSCQQLQPLLPSSLPSSLHPFFNVSQSRPGAPLRPPPPPPPSLFTLALLPQRFSSLVPLHLSLFIASSGLLSLWSYLSSFSSFAPPPVPFSPPRSLFPISLPLAESLRHLPLLCPCPPRLLSHSLYLLLHLSD